MCTKITPDIQMRAMIDQGSVFLTCKQLGSVTTGGFTGVAVLGNTFNTFIVNTTTKVLCYGARQAARWCRCCQ